MSTQGEVAGAFREALVEVESLSAAGGDVGDVEAAIAHATRAATDIEETPALRCAGRLAAIALNAVAADTRRADEALRRAHRLVAAA